MAYFEDRALRALHENPTEPDVARVAGIALLFAVLAAAVMFFAPGAGPASGAADWHGNVAASDAPG